MGAPTQIPHAKVFDPPSTPKSHPWGMIPATCKHSYAMQGQVLDSIDHARYLAVDISSDLNFNHHINCVTANASKSFGLLKRNIKTKHPGIREAAYKTTVRRLQVEYASSVWSPYTKKDIHKVEMVQRRATRWILSSYSPYQSVSELQQQLNLAENARTEKS